MHLCCNLNIQMCLVEWITYLFKFKDTEFHIYGLFHWKQQEFLKENLGSTLTFERIDKQ